MSVGGRCSPLHYTIIVTRQKSAAMIALVWLVALVLSAPVWTGCVALENGAATADADADFLFGSAQQRLDVGSRSQVGASVILGFLFFRKKKKKKKRRLCVWGRNRCRWSRRRRRRRASAGASGGRCTSATPCRCSSSASSRRCAPSAGSTCACTATVDCSLTSPHFNLT